MTTRPPLDDLIAGVRAGDRALLARAITLVESTRTGDSGDATQLLQAVLPETGDAVRIGVSGVPGVGKSTFIEALGAHLTAAGTKVAVLAVDPSSSVTGGSILGDKTRMARLATDDNAFIRPSPGGSTLGGVARRTREAMLLCEAAGYDVVLIETIGVGQSEIAVAGMVDVFLLLALAGAGDELQGIKRGVTEIADLVVITKSDGKNVEAAERAAAQLRAALAMLPGPEHGDPEGHRPVLTCSAIEATGLEEVWDTLSGIHARAAADGRLVLRRNAQALTWMDHALEELLRDRFESHPEVAELLPDFSRAVVAGTIDPTTAARRLLDLFLGTVDGT
jgi:LAO/AO transport system kinase